MLEYITIGLAVISGVTGVLAWIYKRGHKDGIDSACEKRIKEDIKAVEKSVEIITKEKREEHKQIYNKISDVDSKVDEIKGSVDIMKDLLSGHINK